MAGRQISIEILLDRKCASGSSVSAVSEDLEFTLPDFYEREFCCDEEAIGRDQGHDDDYIDKHVLGNPKNGLSLPQNISTGCDCQSLARGALGMPKHVIYTDHRKVGEHDGTEEFVGDLSADAYSEPQDDRDRYDQNSG